MQDKVNEAIELLKEAKDTGSHGMLFTGGKDSMIMLHLWRENIDGQPSLLVIDTYNQFDEIYEFREQIASDWNLEYDIRSNNQFLEEVIFNEDDDRDFAWNGPKTEDCCGALKIDVMGDFISDGYDPLIIGRRTEDIDSRLPSKQEKREPVPHNRIHPLYNWNSKHIQAYIKKHSIPLPEVYYQGYEHTDCIDCVSKGEEGDDWGGVSPEKREQLNNLRDMGYM